MKIIRRNEKNQDLKAERGIGFERVVVAFYSKKDILGFHENKNYPGQQLMIINIDNYAYVVPMTISEDEIDFKTIYPSRKYSKLYNLK